MAHPTALRRLTRPEVVLPCATCGELAGRGYPACQECADRVDRYWEADWLAALKAEPVPPGDLAGRVLTDETRRHPWTCVDWALRMSDCAECGTELATGPPDCVTCAVADERRWARDHDKGSMTDNERALRMARAVLRAPVRHRETITAYWRLLLPFLLTGELAGVQRGGWLRASLRSGRYAELAAYHRYADLAAVLGLPWRNSDQPASVARPSGRR